MSRGLLFRPVVSKCCGSDVSTRALGPVSVDGTQVLSGPNAALLLFIVLCDDDTTSSEIAAVLNRLAESVSQVEGTFGQAMERRSLQLYWSTASKESLPDKNYDARTQSTEVVEGYLESPEYSTESVRAGWVYERLKHAHLERPQPTNLPIDQEAAPLVLLERSGESMPWASWIGHEDVLPVVVGLGWEGDDAAPIEVGGIRSPYSVVIGASSDGGNSDFRKAALAIAKALGKLLGLGDEGTDVRQLSAPDQWLRAFPNLFYSNIDQWIVTEDDLPWPVEDGGPFLGGLGLSTNVYRASEHCIMGSPLGGDADTEDKFCPICRRHLETILLGALPTPGREYSHTPTTGDTTLFGQVLHTIDTTTRTIFKSIDADLEYDSREDHSEYLTEELSDELLRQKRVRVIVDTQKLSEHLVKSDSLKPYLDSATVAMEVRNSGAANGSGIWLDITLSGLSEDLLTKILPHLTQDIVADDSVTEAYVLSVRPGEWSGGFASVEVQTLQTVFGPTLRVVAMGKAQNIDEEDYEFALTLEDGLGNAELEESRSIATDWLTVPYRSGRYERPSIAGLADSILDRLPQDRAIICGFARYDGAFLLNFKETARLAPSRAESWSFYLTSALARATSTAPGSDDFVKLLAFIQSVGYTDRPGLTSSRFGREGDGTRFCPTSSSRTNTTQGIALFWTSSAIPEHVHRFHRAIAGDLNEEGGGLSSTLDTDFPGRGASLPTAYVGSPLEMMEDAKDLLETLFDTPATRASELSSLLTLLEDDTDVFGWRRDAYGEQAIELLRASRLELTLHELIESYGSTFEQDLLDAFEQDLPRLGRVIAIVGRERGWLLALKGSYAGGEIYKSYDAQQALRDSADLTQRQLAAFGGESVYELVEELWSGRFSLDLTAATASYLYSMQPLNPWSWLARWVDLGSWGWCVSLADHPIEGFLEHCRRILLGVWANSAGDEDVAAEIVAFWKKVAEDVVGARYYNGVSFPTVLHVLSMLPWQVSVGTDTARALVLGHLETIDGTHGKLVVSGTSGYTEISELAAVSSVEEEANALIAALDISIGTGSGSSYYVQRQFAPDVLGLASAIRASAIAAQDEASRVTSLLAEPSLPTSMRTLLEARESELTSLQSNLEGATTTVDGRISSIYIAEPGTTTDIPAATADFQGRLRAAVGAPSSGANPSGQAEVSAALLSQLSTPEHLTHFLELSSDLQSEVHAELSGISDETSRGDATERETLRNHAMDLYDSDPGVVQTAREAITGSIVESALSYFEETRGTSVSAVLAMARERFLADGGSSLASLADSSMVTAEYLSSTGDTNHFLGALLELLGASSDDERLDAIRRMCCVRRKLPSVEDADWVDKSWWGAVSAPAEVDDGYQTATMMRDVVFYPEAYIEYVGLYLHVQHEDASPSDTTFGDTELPATTLMRLALVAESVDAGDLAESLIDPQLLVLGRSWAEHHRRLLWFPETGKAAGVIDATQLEVIRASLYGSESYRSADLIEADLLYAGIRLDLLQENTGDYAPSSWLSSTGPNFIRAVTGLELVLAEARQGYGTSTDSSSLPAIVALGRVLEAAQASDVARQQIASYAASAATTVAAIGAAAFLSVVSGGAASPLLLAVAGGASGALASYATNYAIQGADHVTSRELQHEALIAVVEGVIDGASAGLVSSAVRIVGKRAAVTAAKSAGTETVSTVSTRLASAGLTTEAELARSAFEGVAIGAIEGFLGGVGAGGLRTSLDVDTYNRGWSDAMWRIFRGALSGGLEGVAFAPVGEIAGDLIGRMVRVYGNIQTARRAAGLLETIRLQGIDYFSTSRLENLDSDSWWLISQLLELEDADLDILMVALGETDVDATTNLRDVIDVASRYYTAAKNYSSTMGFATDPDTDLVNGMVFEKIDSADTGYQDLFPDAPSSEFQRLAAIEVTDAGDASGDGLIAKVWLSEDATELDAIAEIIHRQQLGELDLEDRELLAQKADYDSLSAEDQKRYCEIVYDLEIDAAQRERRFWSAQAEAHELNKHHAAAFDAEQRAINAEAVQYEWEKLRTNLESATPESAPTMYKKKVETAPEVLARVKDVDGTTFTPADANDRAERFIDDVEDNFPTLFGMGSSDKLYSDRATRNAPKNTDRGYRLFEFKKDGRRRRAYVAKVPGVRVYRMHEVDATLLAGTPSGDAPATFSNCTNWSATRTNIYDALMDHENVARRAEGRPELTAAEINEILDIIEKAPIGFVFGTSALRQYPYRKDLKAWEESLGNTLGGDLDAHHLAPLWLMGLAHVKNPDGTRAMIPLSRTKYSYGSSTQMVSPHTLLHQLLSEATIELDGTPLTLSPNAVKQHHVAENTDGTISFQNGLMPGIVVVGMDGREAVDSAATVAEALQGGSMDYFQISGADVTHVGGHYQSELSSLEGT